jgi:polo-like kinase 1
MEKLKIIEEIFYNHEGDEKRNIWIKGNFLGKGSSAEVYEVTNKETKEKCAAKIINKKLKKEKRKQLLEEIRVHKSLKHDNIVGFISFIESENYYVIILKLCEYGNMKELIKDRKRITEMEARYYLSQLISGVKYIHENKVIHRDLKLANIFLTDELKIKIGDFGLTTRVNYTDERQKNIVGTPYYMAPEIIQPGEVGYSYEVDIWAIGVILYIWVIGKMPFNAPDTEKLYRKILDCNYCFPEEIEISDEVKDLIGKMLEKNSDDRISLNGILEHDFFTKNITPTELPKNSICIKPEFRFT